MISTVLLIILILLLIGALPSIGFTTGYAPSGIIGLVVVVLLVLLIMGRV